jgi:glycosyltransferase involved in cell wall biosynthesis
MESKISVVIITFNEERNIERCLNSIIGVSEDIIIVDSCSTDKTEEICKRYNIRFVSQSWLGFSEQKNVGISYARNNWILSIDADEVLSPDLIKSIENLQLDDQTNIAYEVKILPNYCGKWIRHCGWYPGKKLRLWNKKFGSWVGDVHESLVFTELPENTICLNGDLLHYSYPTIRQHFDKINRYTDILAQKMAERDKKATLVSAIFRAIWSFPRSYIFWLGFLDGYYGFVISCLASQSTFLKYLKVIEYRKNLERK